MTVGICKVELHIPGTNSLKGKRRVLKSLKDRIRNRFNVAVSEIDNHDLYQRATLGIVSISNERRHLDSTLCKVMELIKKNIQSEVIDYETELL